MSRSRRRKKEDSSESDQSSDSCSDANAGEGERDEIDSDNENDMKREQAARLEQLRREQFENGVSDNSERRLEYLMAQSEIFSHFLPEGEESALSSRREASSKRGRTRISEEDEDKRLMKIAQSKSRVTRLLTQPSSVVGGTMRPYQIEGLNWLIKLNENGINGILADEMGLGKTLQTISLLAYLSEARDLPGPHIVIVPKSTVSNWLREFSRWCPSLRTIRLLGNKAERIDVCTKQMIPGLFDVMVASYESCLRESRYIRKIKWDYLVIDEAHRIKNEESSLSKLARMFHCQSRLLITGTPLQNNLHELWALLNFLMPDVFSSAQTFDSWFNTDDETGKENTIKKLHTVLRPFMLRRVKADVEKDLPPKKETKLYIGMTEMQRELYRRVLTKDIESLNALGGPDKVRLLNVLMQLRKVCNHPYLFEGLEEGPPYVDGPHLWQNSGKLTLLDKLLPKLRSQGSRVLIFCQMTRMLDILEDYLLLRRYAYCRIDGSTDGASRDSAMEEFNTPGSEKFCFLLSTRAGGLGINLATADTVILYDSDWNPQVDLQAMDRAHRIGQTKQVRVFRLITEGTVEEKIIERADRKLYLDAAVIQQGRLFDQHKGSLTKGEVMAMVKFGADEILSSKTGILSDEDIDTLLMRGEERTAAMNSKISTEVQHSLANFSVVMEDGVELNMFTFEGENFNKKEGGRRRNTAENSFQISLPQRERRRNFESSDFVVRDPSETQRAAPRRAARKSAMSIPDYQFFNKSRLDEIYAIEADLAAEKASRVATVNKLRHEDAKEKRRALRKSLGWKLPKGQKLSLHTIASGCVGEKEKQTTSAGGVDTAGGDRSDDDSSDEELEEDGEIEANTNQATSRNSSDAPSASKSEMCVAADEIEAELQSGKFDLPTELEKEKSELLEEGFPDWNRADFRIFCGALEKYGRHNPLAVAEDVALETGKTKDNVLRYFNSFWKSYRVLSDWPRIMDRVDRGQRRIDRLQNIQNAVHTKIRCYQESSGVSTEDVCTSLCVGGSTVSAFSYGYGANRAGRQFTEENDRFLVHMMSRHGYGVAAWDKIRREIRSAPAFSFDWFLLSRTEVDIQKRCDYLLKHIEKELANDAARAKHSSSKQENMSRSKRSADDMDQINSGTGKKRKKSHVSSSSNS